MMNIRIPKGHRLVPEAAKHLAPVLTAEVLLPE